MEIVLFRPNIINLKKEVKNSNNKILILSIEDDISTTNVMRWINYLDSSIEVIRMHSSNLSDSDIEMRGISCPVVVKMEHAIFSTNDISVVWMRKWNGVRLFENVADELVNSNMNFISNNIHEEFSDFFDFFIYKIEQNNKTYWFNKPYYSAPNKLKQLFIAQAIGLKTPYSILSTKVTDDMIEQNIITKPISNCICLYGKEEVYSNYTARVNEDSLNKDFFVSFFQQEIQKEMEIRVLYIDGKCYALSILSQKSAKTEVDYRNYDNINPSREEYYYLPEKICSQISAFMDKMNLQTGSLDFILDKHGGYVFLEVNPCGQYDIFNLCNINPDKLIAEHLIKKHYECK